MLFGDDENGSLSPETATTDTNGRAQTTLTLSKDATGEYIVEAYRSDDFGVYVDLTVTIDTSPPRATRLEKISGDNQTGFTGGALANPFVVEVRDQFDDPMDGVTVTFAVTAGGGSLSATNVTTDQDGRAESTLTLAATPAPIPSRQVSKVSPKRRPLVQKRPFNPRPQRPYQPSSAGSRADPPVKR